MLFYDTETVGFHGFAVLIQHAVDDGEIKLFNIWKEPVIDTLELLEWMCAQEMCGFNLVFDHFHLSKLYTTWSELPGDWVPEEHIEEIAIAEEKARLSPLCIKPKSCCDLMLLSKKGKYQSLMPRKDIKVRRVPNQLCQLLQEELEKRVALDGIYFSKRKDPNAPQWSIRDNKNKEGEVDPAFKDIVLSFAPSGSLKVLAEHVLGAKNVLKFVDIEIAKSMRPKEFGYAPFALAVGKPGKWNGAWPEVIQHHIDHWAYNRLAREYAKNDVVYTRLLYHHFGDPEAGDVDSELACMVASVRWRGFKLDLPALKIQRDLAIAAKASTPTAPGVVKAYLHEVMTLEERIVLLKGTAALILISIAGEAIEDDNHNVIGWDWGWMKDGEPHPAAVRAKEVLDARRAIKEIELFDKLLLAGRFHASLKIIGAKSSRMSGADKLNPQGIKSSDEVRNCFLFAEEGFALGIGDFDAFEVCISEAVYKDPKLREDLTVPCACTHCNQTGKVNDINCPICKGKGEYIKKLHALFAMELFDVSYDKVIASKGSKEHDLYTDGKRGVFGMTYGGDANTLVTRLGIDEETAEKAYTNFGKRYSGIARARKRIIDMFCSMTQPEGIGKQVIWKEPADYIESLLGFRRYFTLENSICKALFELANSPPPAWRKLRLKVKRRERMQTISGAVQSALFGAAFAIQGANMRAASNHEIQSTGAEITKRVQKKIWELQPCGVHPWQVQPLNVHDEIVCPCVPELSQKVEDVVMAATEEFRETIPLIKMEWNKEARTWVK